MDLKDESGQTALHKACGFGKLQGVKILVNSGANVNDLEFKGQRPIHFACEEGRQDIVQYLLTKGAKCSVQDKDGLTPLHMCSKNGKEFIETSGSSRVIFAYVFSKRCFGSLSMHVKPKHAQETYSHLTRSFLH